MNLCEAAFAGDPSPSATNCFLAHRTNAAAEEAARRRKEVTDDASRRRKCEEYKHRMTEGDLRADWNTKDAQFWFYIGSDPDLKGWSFWPDEWTVLNSTGFHDFKP